MNQRTQNGTNATGQPKIEAGCGVARGSDPYAAGRKAAQQAMTAIACHPLSAVIAFASAAYPPGKVLAGIRDVVGAVPLFGASSAGEICNRTFADSVTVMTLASPFLKVSVGLGRSVAADWRKAVREAIARGGLERFFDPREENGYDEMTREGRSVFAMLFSPGSTADYDSRSPQILEELKTLSRGRIPFFGGAAIDAERTKGRRNFVFSDGQAHADGLVLALFETPLKFGIAMGHGFHPTAKRAVVTKVRDCELLELDGKPAADVLASLHDRPRAELEGKPLFEQGLRHFGIRHALGQYTLFVPRHLTPEGGVVLAHPAPEGALLVLMETIEDDVVAAGRDTLLRAMMQSGIGEPAAILVCSCFLRTLLLGNRANEEVSAIADLMPGSPVVGFYSAGEQGINDDHVSRHNNEAVAILILGKEFSYAAQVAKENRKLRQTLEFRLAEQKRLENELAEQILFLQTFMDNIPYPVFYKDLEGCYLDCNRAFEEYFEIRRQDLLGRKIQELKTVDRPDIHTNVDQELLQRGGKIVYEATIQHTDGGVTDVITNKVLFRKANGAPSGIIGVLVDITERKRAEQALRASEAKFMLAFHGSPTMMVISSIPDGRIIEVSDSLLSGMGTTREEILGRTSVELGSYVNPEQRDQVLALLAAQGSVRNVEVPMYDRDGAIRHCLFSAERIQLEGREHNLVLLQDISDRKQAEAEKSERLRLQSVLDMAGTICHEFNQPMQILSGYTDLLLSAGGTDSKVEEKLRQLKEQVERMRDITRKLLAIKGCAVQDYAGIGRIMEIHADHRRGIAVD